MKQQSILFILLLLQVLLICCGCGSSGKEAEPQSAAAAKEAAADTEEAAAEEAAAPVEDTANAENVEDAVGTFEGLEDNHTAIFSFDGPETAFYFEEPAVQNVLFEAVAGSSYTLSYLYDDSLGYVIYEISE